MTPRYLIRKICFIIPFCCMYLGAFAQNEVGGFQPNILLDEVNSIEHIHTLIDENNDLTLDEVRQQFNKGSAADLKQMYKCKARKSLESFHSYWWHTTVQNKTTTTKNWVMEVYKSHVYEVHIIQNGRITRTKTGELVNTTDRNFLLANNCFQFELLPGEQIELFIKHRRYFIYCPLPVLVKSLNHKTFETSELNNSFARIFELIFINIAFFLSIFTFLQFLLHKDKSYLYYALYLLVVSLYFLQSYEKDWTQHILFSNILEWYFLFEPPITYSIILLYGLFAQSVIEFDSPVKKAMKRTISLLASLIFFALIIHILLSIFHEYHTVHDTYIQLRRILLFFTVPIIFLLLKNGTKLSYLFLCGTLILILGALATFWADIGLNIYFIFGFEYNQVGIMRISMLVEFLCFSTALGYKTRLTQEGKTRVERELVSTELKALKAQLNPHFIFNCLTSIRGLIEKRQNNRAGEYLQYFAQLIRSTLEYSEKQVITLEAELAVSELYLKMEALRFDQSFSYEISIKDNIDPDTLDVPPLVFQPYLENAIHHGLRPKTGDKKLCLEVYQKENKIVCAIDDNGIGRQASSQTSTHTQKESSFGMRIAQNRIEQYSKLIGEAILISIKDKTDKHKTAQGTRIEVFFPLTIH